MPTRAGKNAERHAPLRVPLPPGTQLLGGAFRIVDVIGEGGFSITYIGLEGSRQLTVAIKELFPLGCVRQGSGVAPANHWEVKNFETALQDFISEGKVLKYFTHPGIVQSYAPFEENGTAYLAMEFLQGESLLLGLQRRGAMNQSQALDVTQQVGAALAFVHTSDVIHSDIKPENIIYTGDARFVIIDFGISRRYTPGRANKAAVVAVSPGYSPPEQYHASRPLTPATDVYSLAATVYTMLSFTVPPDAASREKGEPLPSLLPLNPTVTPHFWKILERALDLDPLKRPQSISEFVLQLGGQDVDPIHLQVQSRMRTSESSLQVGKMAEFEAHKRGIYSLILHPHQPLLLSGARNGSVGLWTWPHGEPVGVLKAHDTALTGFAISPDGTLLATAGEPGEVKLWLRETAQMLRVLRSGLPAVFRLAFSHDSQTVAAAMADGTIHLFHPQLPKPLILPGHVGVVNCVAFSPDGTLLASAGQDGAINLWSLHTTTMVGRLIGHNQSVGHIEFSQDSKLLLSGSNDYTARIWEIQAGLELRRYREEGAVIWSVAFTCDPDLVVTASADKKLRFYRLSTGRKVGSVDADKQHLRSVACDPRRPMVATGGADGNIRIWLFQP